MSESHLRVVRDGNKPIANWRRLQSPSPSLSHAAEGFLLSGVREVSRGRYEKAILPGTYTQGMQFALAPKMNIYVKNQVTLADAVACLRC